MKKLTKKIIAILITVVSVISMFSTTVVSTSAASYSTGTYTVSSSSGINVRKGAGTSYSIVGAAKKGVSFTVTKISGEWGYTSSIKCTNGTKSGWVSLKYCSVTYSTGTYSVSSSSGINVRKGASTSYSIVGAAKKGVSFSVTKISGEWGYTSSIKCTNGTKSGWVSLKYCNLVPIPDPDVTTTTSASTIKLNVPYYLQNDSRWKNTYIGTKTIGQVGCLTTCIAMTYSYNSGKTVYPNAVVKKLSYSNNCLYWSSISKVGLTSKSYNSKMSNSIMSTIYSKLKSGKPVIIGAMTSSGGSEHWVVITGYTGKSTTSFSTADFTVQDPNSTSVKTLKSFLANGSGTDRTKIIRIIY
ncbi:MAG: SH3 domain-containing protein [Ruminococcus sp.]|nr:SH3 domain-containing protein [Ruminococcus sp.]